MCLQSKETSQQQCHFQGITLFQFSIVVYASFCPLTWYMPHGLTVMSQPSSYLSFTPALVLFILFLRSIDAIEKAGAMFC